jgi:hypothetical protein
MQRLSLSVMAAPTALTASFVRGIRPDVVVGDSGPNSIRITSVEFVIKKTELSSAAPCTTPPPPAMPTPAASPARSNGDDGDEDDEDDDDDRGCELQLGPLLVALPLTASPPVRVLDTFVPPGTFTKLEVKLGPIDSTSHGKGQPEFFAANPAWAGLSVKVTGVYTDTGGVDHPFTFTSSASARLKIEFEDSVMVDSTTHNLTITVNVAKWFINSSGAVVDPRSPGNAARINLNIANSFRCFRDDDHDGHEEGDDGGHDGGDDGHDDAAGAGMRVIR